MYLYKTCDDEVMKVLKNLDNKSSSGVDSIGNNLVKITSDETVP